MISARPAGESNNTGAFEWLSVRLRDGRRVGLLPIQGGLTEHSVAGTPLRRRTERLMATVLAQLYARGLTLGAAKMPAVHSLWARTGGDPVLTRRT